MTKSILYARRGSILALGFAGLVIIRSVSQAPAEPRGLAIIILGWLLRIWAGMYISGHTNSTKLSGETLATSGLYSFTRNPLYAANMIIITGLLVYTNGLSPIFFPAFIIGTFLLYHSIILKEEQYLLNKFGEQYVHYKARTPRWISLSPFYRHHDWKPRIALAQVLDTQKGNILNSSAAVLLLHIDYVINFL